jgi:hypothetical protein
MPQSRILSFFAAVPDQAYESQLERDRQEHSVDREAAQVEQALRRAQQRQQNVKRPGRPRKTQPADVVLQRPFKSGVVNEFTRWMSTEIHHLVKGGMAPAEIKVDTGLARLKPKLVGWTWGSWDKLRRKKELIKEGWRKCGLGDVLDAAQQREAMRFCLNEPVEVLGEEPEQQDAGDTDNEDEVEPDINIED